MRISLHLSFLIILMGIASATRTEAQEPGAVQGIVVKAGTTQGLGEATVRLTAGSSRYTVMTASDGRFTIAKIQSGNYLPSASKGDIYHADTYHAPFQPPGPAPFVQVNSGQTTRGLKLELEPSSAISGRIIDEQGAPIRDVVVDFLLEAHVEGRREFISVGIETRTNSRGEFRKAGLLPGEYYVVATPKDMRRDFALTYYPGVTRFDDAMKLTVPPGQDVTGLSFAITNASLHSVRFKVVTGAPPAGLPIRIATQMHREDGFETHRTYDYDVVDANTYIVPRLASGVHHITITWGSGYGLPQPTAELLVAITDRDVDLGTIAVGPVRTISGRILLPKQDDVPLEQALVRIVTWRQSLLTVTVPVKADGAFRAELPEGRYHLSVIGLPASSYIRSIQYGNKETVDTGLLIDSDPPGPVDIAIAFGLGAVTGVVHNKKGELIYNAQVALLPPESRRTNLDLIRTTTTDPAGGFTFKDVPPGDYSLVALETFLSGAQFLMSSEAVKDQAYMQPFVKYESKIVVDAGAERATTLDIVENFKSENLK